MMQSCDLLIIGAGGAGMMCAAQAARRGRRVLLLDHATQIGAKILISGGGRCNFTNTGVVPERYVSANPDFCRSALSRYTPADFIALVEKYQIAHHEKKLGQLFCDGSARQIVDMLLQECREAGVEFHLGLKVLSVAKTPNGFFLNTSRGEYSAASLVVATGGLSLPKTGATNFGYEIARQFGIKIVSTVPALDGFVLDNDLLQQLEGLAGVSLDVIVTCHKISFRENILFTHQGLSGPAALQASLYWNPGDPITIQLAPESAKPFPKSFAKIFSQMNLSNEWKIFPTRTVGFSKAEVTRGGVSTEELSSKTMESKKVPGLYFIGEVVDVTGWLGGYNFQWAWSSGWSAGEAV